MSPDKQKSIAAMRTFARDLDRERGHTDTDAPVEPKKTPHNKDTKHTAAAPKAVPDAPPATVPAATPIPAFHELQKKGSHKTVTPTLQAAPSGNKKSKKGIVPSKSVGEGTIITDTKIERSSFFVALAASLSAWVRTIKKQFKPKPKRTYTVTSTERRRGVVQKATSKSGAMFSADKAELEAIIRKRQLGASETSHEPELEWSPFTEPGFLLLDGDHEEIVASAPSPKTIQKSVVVTPKQSNNKAVFEPPAPPPPVAVDIPPTPAPAPVPAPTIEPPQPTPEPDVFVEEPVPEEETEAEQFEEEVVEVEDIEEDVPPPFRFWSREHLTNLSTNEMTVLIVGFILVVGVGSLIAYALLTNEAASTVVEMPPAPTAITNVPLKILELVPPATGLSLVVTAAETERSTELVVVRTDGNIDNSFLTSVASADGESFIRASRDARILVTGAGERVLLVPVVDSISARGGLLDWESTMYRDVAELLGYTAQTAVPATYVDAPIDTIDTRQVRTTESVVLLYGFGTSELVIIAPSVGAFTEAVNVLAE